MAGIDPTALFPNSRMSQAAKLGQSRFRSEEVSGALADAPSDGGLYARQNGVWVEVPQGNAAIGEWTYINTLTAPPSSGQIRLNNAAQASATHMFLSDITALTKDVTIIIGLIIHNLSKLILQDKTDATKYVVYTVSGAPAQLSGYLDITLTFSSAGNALSSGQRVLLTVINA